jgi:hypothetical protein
MGAVESNLPRIHGQRLHQQAIAEALVVENFMWVVGEHCCSKLLFLTHRCIGGRECT